MTDTRHHILKTLAYFDIFHYPLLKEEIARFHGRAGVGIAEIEEALSRLVEDNCIYRLEEFYALRNDPALCNRRREGNRRAAEQMKTAVRAAGILSRFPFVKGLAISGSLSKNFSSDKTDIDFFIITETGRLWIARTLMHLYKKFTFLTGREKWFCMNYYVDESGMEIEEKNIFTAMEIATLLPMHGKRSLDHFLDFNNWLRQYLPAGGNATAHVPEISKGPLRKMTESLFNNRMGNWLDNRFMRITRKRWEKKESQQIRNEHGVVLSMLVDKHFAKPNPVFFQHKVVEKYNLKLESLPNVNGYPVKTG